MTNTPSREVAELLPEAQVVATDIVELLRGDRPGNLHFELENIDRPWARPRCSFDLINVRHLLGDIRTHIGLCEKSFHATTPGGTFQLTEICHRYVSAEGAWPDGSAWAEASAVARRLQLRTGRLFVMDRQYLVLCLRKAGFKNIRVTEKHVPVREHLQMVLDRIESLFLWDGNALGSSCETMGRYVSHLRSRLASEAQHAHML